MHYKIRNDIIKELFARTTLGIKFGLDRILKATEYIGNPQHSLNIIHVAGTNGKGSVCAFIESILRHQGYATGLFTSPHIINFEERFLINGKPIPPDEWIDVYHSIKGVINQFTLTFFEVSTIIALEIFKRKNVDWAVIETGLGGRLDATNIVIPKVAVITNVGIDHKEYLGKTIKKIAYEKLGIVKSGVPLVLGVQEEKAVYPLAHDICKAKDSPLFIVDSQDAINIDIHANGSSFTYNSTKYCIPLKGIHQVYNALCSLKTMSLIYNKNPEEYSEGIKNTFFPGRFQEKNVEGKCIIFDVAHNPQAVKSLCNLLKYRYYNQKICIISGLMADKDISTILNEYAKIAEKIILTCPKISRAADPNSIVKKMYSLNSNKIKIIFSVKEAVFYALSSFHGIICITGSFYTVGEAMSALCYDPY